MRKSVHNFLSNPAGRKTDTGKNITNFLR